MGSPILLALCAFLLITAGAQAQTRLGNRVQKFEVWGNQKLQWLTGNGKGYTEGMTVPHAMGAATPLSVGPWTVDFCFESLTSGKWGFVGLAPYNTSIPVTHNPDSAAIVISDASGPVSLQNAAIFAVFGDSLGHSNPNFDTCSPTEHGITVQFLTIDVTQPVYVFVGAVLSKPGDVSGSGVPVTVENSSSTKNGNWQGAQYSNGNRTTNIQSPDPFVQLPVELVSFQAVQTRSGFVLEWETASERDNAGFAIEQSSNRGPWNEIGWVQGAGTTTNHTSYVHRVVSADKGLLRFRLRQVDVDGSSTYSAVIEVVSDIPGTHYLSEVYPNPFNPTTGFSLMVAVEQDVSIDVFDVLGQRVLTLFKGRMEAGVGRTFNVEAGGLATGSYTIVVRGLNFVDSRNVVLLK